jgi:tetratricopeptide (TPR) repeat protein
MNAGRYDRAEKRLARAVEIDPSNPTTQYYLGTLRMKQPKADYTAAIDAFNKAKDSPTMGTEARFALSDCLRRLGNTEGSLRELEGALSSQPGNMRVRLGLVDAYLNSVPPRWTDAERVINDAKALPGYVPNADLLEREASMRASRNEPDRALAAMKEAHELAPTDTIISRKYIRTLIKLRKFPEVNAEVDKLLAQDKKLWWAYSARAEAKRFQGKKEEAIKDFDAALAVANELRDDNAADEIVRTMGDVIGPAEVIDRIRPKAENDDRWKLMLARLQSTQGDNVAATKTIEQVLVNEDKLEPFVRENALRYAAMLYLVGNQAEKSAKCYERLLTLAPDDTISLNNMACLLAESVQPPRPQEGLKYSEHAYKLMRDAGRRDAIVMDTHGWLLTLVGRVDEGIELLRAANDVSPLPDIHYHLGEAYLKKQFGEEAQRELQVAKDMIERQQRERPQPDVYLQQLQGKVENAMARALMVRTKKSTANAPTATNVP